MNTITLKPARCTRRSMAALVDAVEDFDIFTGYVVYKKHVVVHTPDAEGLLEYVIGTGQFDPTCDDYMIE